MTEGGAVGVVVGGRGGGGRWGGGLGGGGRGGGGRRLAADEVGLVVAGVGVGGGDDDGSFGGGAGGDFGFLGGGEESAVAEPGADGVVVGGGAVGDDVAGVLEVEGADRFAGSLDGVNVAGLEDEGDGVGEVDSGVFKVAVDEEGDGDEAGGGGLGELAGPLVDPDGAGDFFGRFDPVGLGEEGREESGAEAKGGADGGARVHACEFRRGWLRCGESGGRWLARYSDEIQNSMLVALIGMKKSARE